MVVNNPLIRPYFPSNMFHGTESQRIPKYSKLRFFELFFRYSGFLFRGSVGPVGPASMEELHGYLKQVVGMKLL